ncbi:MerR family transcriptional regulator [Streptomyces sp. NPDC012389]|uniref:MerR family transcriptional regulator n=1 Tax=unclassified Streptomyces TaxID=2593676 RepID=UPI00081EEC0B|nr:MULTISPECIES: MerR family transcriptional regulator [unclassified Streptomyces]MYR98185.1 MerR family transcriptional regulator [Streptomyces sp. SID4937]MYX12119.1 MerR family transcriptional regulator [Streptomyces sp. SID8374]SCE35224.1 DNA-binding transcriptional regulator, MerR family [Streptomyces sp. ScaeMP-e83]
MRIGELAARTGVSTRALRYYEEQDLLVSDRSPSGQRRYPESAVERVELVQQLYAAGLSSRTIVALLPCVVDGSATPGLIQRLAAERDRIDQRLADLTRARNRLDSVITAASDNLVSGRSCRPETGR